MRRGVLASTVMEGSSEKKSEQPGRGAQPQQECDAPAPAALGRKQPAHDAADARDAPRAEHQQHRAGADEQAARRAGGRGEGGPVHVHLSDSMARPQYKLDSVFITWLTSKLAIW